ncbi:MAG: hypothetical protein KI790_14585 [Cyclobacteriaceae bacterium]|nr:hypothetical protein [Cyclobacteriaceae bacterium HetDA_MAG_MS6]
MDIQQLRKRNLKFQEASAKITEFLPGVNLLPLTTTMIRSCRKIDSTFPRLLVAKTELRFNQIIERIEEEIDEVIWALDKLQALNAKENNKTINDFIKYGYDLLSIYSFACDKIIERRVKEEV